MEAQATRKLPSHLRYAKLSADLPPEPKRTPSMLAAELKGLSRPVAALRRPRVVGLLNMSEFTHNLDSVVPLEEPLFQPSPPEVVFDAFEPHGKYSMVLRFRNNDKVNRRLKVLKVDSTVFSVEPPKSSANGSSKVAPGMEVAYRITFMPRAAEDYSCDLVCLSEREKFLVNISARGPRSCFEFPDGVDFGLQPVRANATEAFLLRNTGLADGRFVLSVPKPFSVTPSDGALKAGEAMQLTFGFQPQVSGEYAEELLVEYDSGERCYARLSGASSDVEVGLERSLLLLEPCYISLLSQVNATRQRVKLALAHLLAQFDVPDAVHNPHCAHAADSFSISIHIRRRRLSCTTARTSRCSLLGGRTGPSERTMRGEWMLISSWTVKLTVSLPGGGGWFDTWHATLRLVTAARGHCNH